MSSSRQCEARVQPSVLVLLADLKECSRTRNLELGRKLHAEAAHCGLDSSVYVATALVNMYAKCGCMVAAHRMFDCVKHPNVVSWSVLILGYAENGQGLAALDLFRKMSGNATPNSATFLAALKACMSLAENGARAECRTRGQGLHNLSLENGCYSHIYVQTTLIEMYARCGSLHQACQVYDNMSHSNLVSLNVLILGYAENGQGVSALVLFKSLSARALAPNSITFMAVFKACTSVAVGIDPVECREWGKQSHNLAVEFGCDSELQVKNTLIDMYAKCSSMVEARRVFHSIKRPDVVSWNILIMGYADRGQGLNALNLFTKMTSRGRAPDSVTFLAALKACGCVGGLEFGRKIHSQISRGCELVTALVNCLVDFYAKCGSMLEAQSVFDLHGDTRDVVTWTALLTGFSSCGDHESVFRLLERMQDAGVQPSSITLLSILACCSHAGLVEKGKECFDSMTTKYGLAPTIEHYNCMVDCFGRVNKLGDAMALLACMPCSPNDVTWRSILSACRKWRNVELGRLAFQSSVNLSDRTFVLMGQIYASRGMMQEQARLMEMRTSLKAWRSKSGGQACWTNDGGEVHAFS